MIRLRKALLCDYLYYLALFLIAIISLVRLSYKYESIHSKKTKEVVGTISSISIDNKKLSIVLQGKEKVLGNYYFTNKKQLKSLQSSINLGDKVLLKGKFSKTNNYYERQEIYYRLNIKKIYLIKKNKNLIYFIREKVLSISKNPYVSLFILGDKSKVNKDVLNYYKEIGISHLFAISGMHITLLATIILKVLKRCRINEKKRYLIVSLFLLFYYFLTGGSPSILRAVLFFYLFSINNIFYFYIKNTNIFILVLVISLLVNPRYIFEVS